MLTLVQLTATNTISSGLSRPVATTIKSAVKYFILAIAKYEMKMKNGGVRGVASNGLMLTWFGPNGDPQATGAVLLVQLRQVTVIIYNEVTCIRVAVGAVSATQCAGAVFLFFGNILVVQID
jgi:hypothetical protein